MRKTGWIIFLLATVWLTVGVTLAQPLPTSSVTVLVNRDGVNVRIAPALGADVLGIVPAGWTAPGTGRSPDNEWVRVDFNGQEGWIGFPVITIIAGDISTLPVADPRSIPYGGFESPRSGATDASSPISGRLAQSGLRLRAGPSTAYPVLANPLRYTVFPVLGRTANNAWLQVNFNGTLGWVTAGFVELSGGSLLDLPIDGITASSPPLSQDGRDSYLGTLRLMIERLDLAQPSLDSIRGTWTTVALGERSACQNFPARPSDINIPNDVLAANYPTLEPLRVDFNSAMAQVRQAVDLWIEACGQPSPPNGVVGQATVIGALNTIQFADGLFADLRRRINALLPPDIELGANQCLFTFNDQFDILDVLGVGQVITKQFTPRKTAFGFCFDAPAGAVLRIELLNIKGNQQPLVAVSPFDNPTQFLAVGRAVSGQNLITLGPVRITTSGRYLLIVADQGSDDRTDPLFGDYALLITNLAGVTVFGPGLGIDPTTGQVVVNPMQSVATSVPGVVSPTATASGAVLCPSTAFTCSQLFSCAEAQACLQAGNFSLDQDNDGIPCEENLCAGS